MSDPQQRKSYEVGHRPKFMVVADDTPEFDRALFFAARRAARTSSGVVILAVVAPQAQQEWLGVGDLMQAEAEEAARHALAAAAARVRAIAGLDPEQVLRTGIKADEIVRHIEQDEDISLLILAAGTGGEGPGPLVASFAAKGAASFPIPVVIVPGHLADRTLEALT